MENGFSFIDKNNSNHWRNSLRDLITRGLKDTRRLREDGFNWYILRIEHLKEVKTETALLQTLTIISSKIIVIGLLTPGQTLAPDILAPDNLPLQRAYNYHILAKEVIGQLGLIF